MSLPGARSDDIESKQKYRVTFLASNEKEVRLLKLTLKGSGSPFLEEMVKRMVTIPTSKKLMGQRKRNLGVGDLVLILSTDTPRGKWPLGRIVQVFPGPDGHVCTAAVKVQGSILQRPIIA